MENKKCEKCGVWKMRRVMRCVKNAECRKYIKLELKWNKFREHSTLREAVIVMIDGSKISVHRLIATTLFRMVKVDHTHQLV